jgi:hypothetical protein
VAASFRSRWMLPKEQGSWGMFYIPMVLGALAAARWSVALILFLISCTAVFFSREALLAFWRVAPAGARPRALADGAECIPADWTCGGRTAGGPVRFVWPHSDRLRGWVSVAGKRGNGHPRSSSHFVGRGDGDRGVGPHCACCLLRRAARMDDRSRHRMAALLRLLS